MSKKNHEEKDEVTVHKVGFCKNICNDYKGCQNIMIADTGEEQLVAPCSWNHTVNNNKKKV